MATRTVRLIVLTTLTVFVLVLAACASPTQTGAPAAPAQPKAEAPKAAAPTDAPKAAAPTQAAAAAPAGKATAKCNVTADKATTIAYLGNKFPVIEYYADQLKSCEAGNIKVQIDWLPANERDQKATLVLSSGDTAYEIIQATDRNIYEWADKGWIRPLDDLIAKYKAEYKLDDIPDGVWDGIRVNGKIWGFPITQNPQIFFYRKDIYDKHGLKPPTTWAEALDQFKLLAEKKETTYPFAATYAKGSDLAGEFNRALQSNGGQWFDGTKPTFNSAKGVEAANLIKETMKYMPPDILTYNNDKVMIALQQGEVAAAITYVSRTKQMDDPAQSKIVGKIEYAPVPGFTKDGVSGTALGRDNYVIPAKTDVDADLIFRVILEATTSERMKGAADLVMVPRQSVAQDPDIVKRNRYLPAVDAALKRGILSNPKVPFYSLASGAVGTALADALAGGTSIQEALDRAAKEYETQAKEKGFIK